MSPLLRFVQLLVSACSKAIARLTRREDRTPRLGRFIVAERLGAGAMGEVHRAWDPVELRWCALKTLGADASSEQRARFEREATLSKRFRHRNAVKLFESGTARDGTPFYTMELVDGCTLRERVERDGAQSPARVLDWLLQLCAALRAVHGAGLVHRDIKPDNVLVTCVDGHEVVKLVDFGLVQELGATAEDAVDTIVGTPLYLAPEAITAPARVGPSSDLYGVGAVAYFLLSGGPVFRGAGLIEVCCQHLYSEPRPILRAPRGSLAGQLERVVMECLAKDPKDRPESAAALSARLERCRTELASSERREPVSLAA